MLTSHQETWKDQTHPPLGDELFRQIQYVIPRVSILWLLMLNVAEIIISLHIHDTQSLDQYIGVQIFSTKKACRKTYDSICFDLFLAFTYRPLAG